MFLPYIKSINTISNALQKSVRSHASIIGNTKAHTGCKTYLMNGYMQQM